MDNLIKVPLLFIIFVTNCINPVQFSFMHFVYLTSNAAVFFISQSVVLHVIADKINAVFYLHGNCPCLDHLYNVLKIQIIIIYQGLFLDSCYCFQYKFEYWRGCFSQKNKITRDLNFLEMWEVCNRFIEYL